MKRERLFTMRMSDEEHARLERVAAHYGANGAVVVRMLVKHADDAIKPVRAARAKKVRETRSNDR